MRKLLFVSGLLVIASLPLMAQFGSFASAIHLSKDGAATKDFYNTYKLVGDVNAIGPFNFSGDLGTFSQNAGKLIITGGELKSFRGNNDNVCEARMYYRVYPNGSPSGSFTLITLPFFANCTSGVFADGKGPCNPTDQKWQTVAANVDLTNVASPGNYTLELYFEIIGKTNSTTECTETVFDSNFGNNFKANFTISAPLPIKLIDFKATTRQGKALLSWSTLSEENFNKFVVQKSTNGIQFEDLDGIKGKGNLYAKTDYQYIDQATKAGVNFYRLNQIDTDGKSSFSTIVRVNTNSKISVTLSPNPAKDRLFINGCKVGDNISICDITGRTITAAIANNSSSSMPIQMLRNGKYFATITSGETMMSLPFVKE